MGGDAVKHMRMILIAVVLLIAACGGGSVDEANAPPAGTIWFGSSFDATTFAITGRTTTATTGQTVALVASLPRSVGSGEINLRVAVDGMGLLNQVLTMTGSGSYFGTTYGPLPLAGTYLLEITDIGGTVLASGTLTVK